MISSSSLTFQHWTGSYALIEKQDLTKIYSNKLPRDLKFYRKVNSGVCTARWLSNTKFLIGTDCGTVQLLEWNENLDSLMNKQEHDGLVTCLDKKFNSETAVSGSSDCRIKIWDLNEALSTRTIRGHDYPVTSVLLNPWDANCLISTSEDTRTIFWDMRKSKPGFDLKHGLKSFPSCSAWSTHDSNTIILGFANGHIGLFDLRNMSLGSIHKVHERLVRQIKCNSQKFISTASDDCSCKVFQSHSNHDLNLM